MAENKCIVVKFKGYLKFIDLGLPSGTKWAAYNVGATSPYETGDYFSWGNVDGHPSDSGYDFSQENYSASMGSTLSANTIPTGNTYDMAYKNWGAPARVPTQDEFIELVENCTSEWVTKNGVNGLLFTSIINGNKLFFYAAGTITNTQISDVGIIGKYWSASRRSDTNSTLMSFTSSGPISNDYGNRSKGLPVRAVI